ncbi:hypothetical protein PQX77_017791 [Marasmius sp. AFHP31]|nr:hypothetical protein PQX77_017791 [Marasmius sp. AFHP31]
MENPTLQLDKQSTEFVLPDPGGERELGSLRWSEIINLIASQLEHKVPMLRKPSLVFKGSRMLSDVRVDIANLAIRIHIWTHYRPQRTSSGGEARSIDPVHSLVSQHLGYEDSTRVCG